MLQSDNQQREDFFSFVVLKKIRQQFTRWTNHLGAWDQWSPAIGEWQMTDFLKRNGHEVNRKRIQRMLQKMGIEGLSPRRRTTLRNEGYRVYPYLLRNLDIVRPDQVWCCDITYIPMEIGFFYLVAVMD